MKILIAEWEAWKRKRFVRLYKDEYGYCYSTDSGGGNIGNLPNDNTAILYCENSGPVAILKLDFPSVHRIEKVISHVTGIYAKNWKEDK